MGIAKVRRESVISLRASADEAVAAEKCIEVALELRAVERAPVDIEPPRIVKASGSSLAGERHPRDGSLQPKAGSRTSRVGGSVGLVPEQPSVEEVALVANGQEDAAVGDGRRHLARPDQPDAVSVAQAYRRRRAACCDAAEVAWQVREMP